MRNQKKQYCFSKEERLCSKKQIALLFQEGKWERAKTLRIVYLLTEGSSGSSPKILISVPKKIFKRAVIRNKLKRRIREAYRLNKDLIYKTSSLLAGEVLVGVIYTSSKEEEFITLEKELILLLKTLEEKLRKSLPD